MKCWCVALPGGWMQVEIQSTMPVAIAFQRWKTLSKKLEASSTFGTEVLKICHIHHQHGEKIDCQNLAWTCELLIKNIDAMLQQHVLSACENLLEHALHGLFAFNIMAERVMSMTQNLAHNVHSGPLVMSLCNFQGENVVECVFSLRNVICFLNCGVPGFDRTLPLLMDNLHNIFMSAMNIQFRNCIQNMKDFHWHMDNTPEALFVRTQDCHDNIIAKSGAVWLKTEKLKPAFTVGAPSQCKPVGTTPQQVIQPAPAPAPSTQATQSGGGTCQPRKVDCTKPKEEEPHTCINEHGCEEHWCFRCPKGARWVDHLAKAHKEWLNLFHECKE